MATAYFQIIKLTNTSMQINSISSSQSTRNGFTLVELLVSIALVSLVAAYFIQYQIEALSQRVAESLAQDMLSISNTSLAYFSQALKWPDQDNDCAGLIGVLRNAGAFPIGYDAALDVDFATDCADNNVVGRVLNITATFPAGAKEEADLLMSYLPTSSMDYDQQTQIAVVEHYVAQPRNTSQRYQFFKGQLNNGAISIPKPDCWGNQTQNYFLIPQAVCIAQPNAQYGIGGYYFRQTGEDNNSWNVVLRVANGDDNNNDNDFYNAPNQCGNETISVGAITYCE